MWEIYAIPFLIGAGGFWLALRENRKRLQRWHDAATTCGLQVVEKSRFHGGWLKLTAREGPLEARIEDSRRKDVGTRIVISVPGPPGFPGVKIRRETFRTSAREIEIGDATFDATFSIEGPMRLVAVLLDAEMRSLLTRVNAVCRRMGIAGGQILVELSDFQVSQILALLLDIARRLAQPVDAAERLAGNAHRDPEAGARLLNLRLLVREFPGDPGTREALRRACSDPIPQIRLRAARELGAEGRDVLLEMVESQVDDDCTAQAVAILGGELPVERTKDLLVDALRRRRLQTARACAEALGRAGGAMAVDVLVKVLAREEGELAAAAALALGATRSETAEPPLIEALGTGRTDIRVAVAKALGRVGSVASVFPLKEAAENLSWDADLCSAARQSIAEIQSRLPGASPGQLSLAGAEEGQLSLAADPAGQLSIPEDEPGAK